MIGLMNNRVSFYKKGKSGPEAFDEGLVKYFECFCNEYNPTVTDHTIKDLNTSKSSIALKIRRNLKGPQIKNTHLFSFHHGYSKDKTFQIVSIELASDGDEFLKIIGQEIGEDENVD